MRKSITGLICGLIGSLFSLWWGFTFGFFGNILNIIPSEEAANLGQTLTILGWIAFFGAIVGIVGASLSVKQARKGAICLTIATIMCGILQMYIFIKTLSSEFIMTAIVVFLLPTILLLVAAIFAWIAKEKAVPVMNMGYQQPQQNFQPQQPQQPQQKTLEQELNDLKGMLDKGLITEEEFADTKKAILAKYTK